MRLVCGLLNLVGNHSNSIVGDLIGIYFAIGCLHLGLFGKNIKCPVSIALDSVHVAHHEYLPIKYPKFKRDNLLTPTGSGWFVSNILYL